MAKRSAWMRPADDVEVPCRRHGTTHEARQFNGRMQIRKGLCVWVWDVNCKQARQEIRIERKHEDLALHIVTVRAQQVVAAANKDMPADERITTDWVIDPRGLNYQSKVWEVRAYLDNFEEATCANCGDPFATENDGITPKCDHKHFTFDHIEPPRGPRDWERLHARNLIPRDPECNSRKSDMVYAEHLAIEWHKTCVRAQAERAVLVGQVLVPPSTVDPRTGTMSLFGV